jgi:hypothetical protein
VETCGYFGSLWRGGCDSFGPRVLLRYSASMIIAAHSQSRVANFSFVSS